MQMRGLRLPQFARFLSVGVVNTLAGLGIIFLVKWLFHAGDITANAIGYSVGTVVSFALNSSWTFGYRGPRLRAIVGFLLVALAAYGMNLLAVVIAVRFLGINGYLSQIIGIPPYVSTSYFLNKHMVFKA